jgi:ABC-type sugar transport system substrate-binding protein
MVNNSGGVGMKRAVFVLMLIGFIVVSFSAFCGSEKDKSVDAEGDVPKIRFIMMGLNNPYTSAQARYTEEWAKKLGWDYVLYDGELDAKKNAEYLDYAISENPDLIILMPIDSTAVSKGIKKAYDAGIPVIMEHMQANPEDEQYTLVYTGPGNYVQGQLVAEMFHEKLNGKGNVVEVTCVPGQETTIGRHNGFVERLEELNSGVKLIASNNGDAQVDLTLQVMEDFLTRFGADGIDGIYTCDDTMAVAATIALKEAGIPEGSIPIIGVGGSKQGLASIKSGAMYGTIVQSPQITQVQTVEIVQKILKEGLKPPYQFDPYYQYVDHPKCTAANVEEFMPGDW